ncbi:MAG: hypothetical protein ABIO14_12445 [Aeromicrobium sp.]
MQPPVSGTVLVTPEEIADGRAGPGDDLATSVLPNGEVVHSRCWSTVNWSFGQMISYAAAPRSDPAMSSALALQATGASSRPSRPRGGSDDDPSAFRWRRAGDQARVEVESLGAVDITIDPADEVVPLS